VIEPVSPEFIALMLTSFSGLFSCLPVHRAEKLRGTGGCRIPDTEKGAPHGGRA
jgi:hypothetical protein